MTVKELMSSNVFFVTADATVTDAAILMKKNNIGLVPVCDSKGCILGLLTDRDILMRTLLSDGENQSVMKASEVMSTDILTITSEMNVHEAGLIFSKGKKRRLPVVDNSHLVGILSISDLAKKRIFLAEVGDIMGAIAKKK